MTKHRSNSLGSGKLTRVCVGIFISVVIIVLGLLTLHTLESQASFAKPSLPWASYFLFYLAVAAIYLLTIVLWGSFSRFTGQTRSFLEKIIDTGLLAVGKYVPGKIFGVMSRGAFRSDALVVDRGMLKVSIIEQVSVLSVGSLLCVFFLLNAKWIHSTFTILVVALCCSSWLTLYVILKLTQRYMVLPNPCSSSVVFFSLKQSVGYLLLWVLSSVPILVLVSSSHELLFLEAVQVVLAFTIAMISGWVAFFAPGGLGVRESSFVLLAPEFMGWQEAASWVVLHRILITLFDMAYGLVVSVWVVRNVKALELS